MNRLRNDVQENCTDYNFDAKTERNYVKDMKIELDQAALAKQK